MTETVVHVTTLEQWKSVLDVWFKQGHIWVDGDDTYNENDFCKYGSHQIGLKGSTKKCICCWVNNDYDGYKLIEYSEFMAQQKEDNKMATYYVTQEQLDLIKELKSYTYPFHILVSRSDKYEPINVGLNNQEEKSLLRYLGGDETIEFKVKEPLYRLWATDQYGDKVYFGKNHGFWTSPATQIPEDIFTAPLEKIKKWQTPDWEIEKVEE